MKIRSLLTVFLLLCISGTAAAQKKDVCFFVVHRYSGPDADKSKIDMSENFFLDRFTDKLRENFPCAYENDTKVAHELLGLEYQKQLLGVGSDEEFNNIANAYNIDYLVILELGTLPGNEFIVNASCVPYRIKSKVPMVRAYARAPLSETSVDAMVKACEDAADKIIDGLKKYEICPFIGPVNITRNSMLDSTDVLRYMTYCNEMDQQYFKRTWTRKSSYSEWKLERRGIPRTEGTMTFHASEKSTIEEIDPCHMCSSGREGGRTYTEEKSFEASGSGISHKSVYKGEQQDDTRIELVFLDDGTYVIIVRGTSEPATGSETVRRQAEGTCDNMTPDIKNEPREIKIPLMVVFGPYPGRANDKILQQKDTKDIDDPVTGEKSTYTIDFTLRQKDS